MQQETHDSRTSQAPSLLSSGHPSGPSGASGLTQMLRTASFADGAKMLAPRSSPAAPVQQRRGPGAGDDDGRARSDVGHALQLEAAGGQAAQDLTPLFDKLAGAYFPGTQANARAFIALQPVDVRPALEERLAAYIAQWNAADGRARLQLKAKWKGHYARHAGGGPPAPAATEAQSATGAAPTQAPQETTGANTTSTAADTPVPSASTEPLTGAAARDEVERMIQALEATHANNAAKGKQVQKNAKKGYWTGDIRALLLKGKPLENLVEYSPEQAAQVSRAIGDARALIEKLGAAELGIATDVSGAAGGQAGKAEEAAVRDARGKYHRRLNRVQPYFTQMINDEDILGSTWLKTDEKTGAVTEEKEEAWRGTCNVTSVASALMSRGKSPRDFVGAAGKDVALLERVAAALDPKRFADPSAMYALRMPDFLQLVYILNSLSGGGSDPKAFKAAVMSARVRARTTVTNLVLHKGVPEMFGVKQLEFSTKFNVTKNKAFMVKGKFDVGTYASQIQNEMVPRLNSGQQITINKPGHIVRLVDITDNGIMIDDPAYEGAKFSMDWAKCAAENYFRAHAVYF